MDTHSRFLGLTTIKWSFEVAEEGSFIIWVASISEERKDRAPGNDHFISVEQRKRSEFWCERNKTIESDAFDASSVSQIEDLKNKQEKVKTELNFMHNENDNMKLENSAMLEKCDAEVRKKDKDLSTTLHKLVEIKEE